MMVFSWWKFLFFRLSMISVFSVVSVMFYRIGMFSSRWKVSV